MAHTSPLADSNGEMMALRSRALLGHPGLIPAPGPPGDAHVAEFGLLRKAHPLISARLACIAHPIGAAALFFIGAPAAAAFVLLHGAGNGVLTIVKGTLPLAIFGPEGYGLRQGLLGAPSRFIQACAPFLLGLLIDWYGAASVAVSAACCLSAFIALMALRPVRPSVTERTV